jgi:hypothetical protein
MKRLLSVLMGGTLLWSCAQPKEQEAVAPPEPKALEFADAKYIDMSREGMTKLAEGNVDAYLNNFADNAVYQWNNGDSIVSKQAILDYWKDRRANVIDTITFTNEAWMALFSINHMQFSLSNHWRLTCARTR